MKQTALFFFRHYLFWGLVFLVFRALFLLSLSSLPAHTGGNDILRVFYEGYRLDWSTASYFAVIPFLLTAVLAFGGDRQVFAILRVYYFVVIVLVVVLSLSNILVYKYWGTLLNNRALAFAAQPGEMFASVTNLQIAFIFTLIGILCLVMLRFFNRYLYKVYTQITGTPRQRLLGLIPWLVFIGIGIRGGMQLIPVNESSAAFSTHRVLNQAAINGIWHLGHNLKQSGFNESNPYRWMDPGEAEKIAHDLMSPGQSDNLVAEVFTPLSRPNIVIILLESWTADIIEPLGGIAGVTPEFSRLSKEGLLFTKIYSSGFRTDQALTSVLSGFPAQPNKSIIRFPDKTAKLPALGKVFQGQGYTNSFYYGGETGFANMNSYLKESGFSRITDINDFPKEHRNSKWGVHDGFLFERHAADLAAEKQPFFSVLLTLSTHEPFEVPVQTPFNDSDEPELFKKSAWYTDLCLGDYFRKISQESWFTNTIFIIVADHGHRLPKNRDYFDPAMRRIPLLVMSPLLKSEWRGGSLGMTGCQHDIPATLLSVLGIPHGEFEWSNNLLSKERNHFAYLSLDNSFTWLTDTSGYVVALEPGLPGYGKNPPRQRTAKAYVQHLYERFTGY